MQKQILKEYKGQQELCMTRIEILNEYDAGKRKGTAVDPLTRKKIRWVNTS